MTLKIFFDQPTHSLYMTRGSLFGEKAFIASFLILISKKYFQYILKFKKKKSQNFLSGVSDENIIKNDAKKVFSKKSALPNPSLNCHFLKKKAFFVWFDYKSLNFAYLLPLKLEKNNFQCGTDFSYNKSKHWIDYLVYRCTLPFKS